MAAAIIVVVLMMTFGSVAMFKWGESVGRKKQLTKDGKGILTSHLTLKLPRRDFESIHFGYYNESETATLCLRRADRITIEVKDCKHSEIGLGALTNGSAAVGQGPV